MLYLLDQMLEFSPIWFNHALNKALKTVPLILTVMLLRLLMRRAPKKVRVWLWGVAALGFLLPLWHIPSPFSLNLRAEPVPHSIVSAYEPRVDLDIAPVDTAVNSVLMHFQTNGENSAAPLMIIEAVVSVIWIIGIILIALYAVISTVCLRLKLRTARKDQSEPRVYMSNACPTPFILGVFRPHIYLPETLSDADRKAVLLHERAHIRRGDHLWKLLGFLIAAYFWFDPLVWVGYHLLSKDIELACDERVIRNMDNTAKKDYAEALLHCSLLKLPKAACPLAFGEVAVKMRIASVAKFQMPKRRNLLLAALTVSLTVLCFLTDPALIPHTPEQRYFESAILETVPVRVTNRRACSYIILASDTEPFYDRRNISYHYAAVLVREFAMKDGQMTVVNETFAPMYFWFKSDWLCGCYDLERMKNEPDYGAAHKNISDSLAKHFPDIDTQSDAWKSRYEYLSGICTPETAQKSYKSGMEIDNGGSGSFKMGHFPQTPIFPKLYRGVFRTLRSVPKGLDSLESH